MGASVVIKKHTTASKPRPHVLYVVELCLKGRYSTIERRYAEFLVLHDALGDEFTFPPKHPCNTTFLPSGWIDDDLIAERKLGLSRYLSAILWSPQYRKHPLVLDFLSRGHSVDSTRGVDVEDVLPSTLSRKAAAAASDPFQSQGAHICAAYYPHWCTDEIPPEKLDYKRFDILYFGFVTPNESSALEWSKESQSTLKRLVREAARSKAGTRIVLSIGGWEGSQWFSHICSTSVTRMTFVDAIVSAVDTYGLHGVDIDWEFPNWKGAGNPYSPDDADNLLLLFKALRAALGFPKIISATVGHSPWLDQDGLPLKDVSAFAEELTLVNVMNYGIYDIGSPGPNAPLGNILLQPDPMQATAGGALSEWRIAGFPAYKMLLGLPLFGYVFKSSRSSLDAPLPLTSEEDEHRLRRYQGAHFESTPPAARPSAFGDDAEVPLASWWGKSISFREIVKSGALVKQFDGNYAQGNGYTMGWDDESSTPYLFNTDQRTLVVFDNTRSLAAKVKFAKEHAMAGCVTWSLNQDDEYTMQDVIRTAFGRR